MTPPAPVSSITFQALVGSTAGLAIAYLDGSLFRGEISPIIVLGLLGAAGLAAGMIWRWRGIVSTLCAWVWLPLAHVIRHAAHLPDTVQPNTYLSIAGIGGIALVACAAGLACGALLTGSHQAVKPA